MEQQKLSAAIQRVTSQRSQLILMNHSLVAQSQAK